MKDFLHTLNMVFLGPLGKMIAVLLFLFFFFWYNNRDTMDYTLDFVHQKLYYGVILKKELDAGGKLGLIKFYNSTTKEEDCHRYSIFGQENKGIYEYAALGDTIIKKKGEGRITIKKPNGEIKVFEFNSRMLPDVK